MVEQVIGFVISFAFLMVGVTVHEFAHGWVASMRGDNTAKFMGRLSLNPLAHIDPVMTFLFPLFLYISTGGRFVFGAAKPVPVNFSQLRNPKPDMVLVGLAGPAANFLLAVVLSLAWKFMPHSVILALIFQQLITINVVLGVFNLVPIPPLDGSRLVMGLLPDSAAGWYAQLDRYGFIIIIALMYFGILDILIWPAINLILTFLVG